MSDSVLCAAMSIPEELIKTCIRYEQTRDASQKESEPLPPEPWQEIAEGEREARLLQALTLHCQVQGCIDTDVLLSASRGDESYHCRLI
jgi:hypothetical protein